MRSLKKAAALAAVLLMAVSVLAGCSGTPAYDPHATVATYGDTQIPAYEASYYIRTMQYTYENVYGYENLWDAEVEPHVTMADMVNEVALRNVYQTYVLMDRAEQMGLELTEEQEADVQAAVDAFMAQYPQPVYNAIGVGEDEIYNVFEHNALAMLAYEQAVADVDTNITEEEARHCSVSVVFLYDESSNYDSEAVKDEILAGLESGADLSVLAELYEQVTLNSYTVGFGDFESSFGPAAMELQEGEFTAVHSDTTTTWYVIYCDKYLDEEATESGYDSVLENRKQALFEEAYAVWKEEAPAFEVNGNVLAAVDYSHTMYMDVQLVENPNYDSGSSGT